LQAIASENDTLLTSHGINGIPAARGFGRELQVLMAVGDFEAGPTDLGYAGRQTRRCALLIAQCRPLFASHLWLLRTSDKRLPLAEGSGIVQFVERNLTILSLAISLSGIGRNS
jgi:hypothetical protein